MNRKIREKYKIILDIAKCIKKKKRIQLCWRMYTEKHYSCYRIVCIVTSIPQNSKDNISWKKTASYFVPIRVTVHFDLRDVEEK